MSIRVSEGAISLPRLLEEFKSAQSPNFFQKFSFSARKPNLISYLKQCREEELQTCLQKYGDKVLEKVSERVKSKLDYGINISSAPKDAVVNLEGFKRDAKVLMPGREDLGRLIYITGLTTSGTPWIPTADKLYDYCGIRTEVMTLAGHDGDWFHYRNCNNKDMLEQVLDTVKPNDVVLSFSTSGNIVTQAEYKKPGFCRGHVGIGWAYILRQKENETLIDSVRAKTSLIYPVRKFFHTDYPRNPAEDSDSCPQFVRMPFSVAVELRKSQIAAVSALEDGFKKRSENFGPLLYLQGENDAAICPLVRDFIASGAISSPFKFVPELIPGGIHDVQNGASHDRVFEYICNYLPMLYRITSHLHENVDPKDIPDFKTSIHAKQNLELVEGNIYKFKDTPQKAA